MGSKQSCSAPHAVVPSGSRHSPRILHGHRCCRDLYRSSESHRAPAASCKRCLWFLWTGSTGDTACWLWGKGREVNCINKPHSKCVLEKYPAEGGKRRRPREKGPLTDSCGGKKPPIRFSGNYGPTPWRDSHGNPFPSTEAPRTGLSTTLQAASPPTLWEQG